MVNAISSLTQAVQQQHQEAKGREHDNSSRSRRCYNCHELGHLSYECQQAPTASTMEYRKQRHRPAFSATCYACNQVGHYANLCPARAQAGGNGQSRRPAGRADAGAQPRNGAAGNAKRA